MAAINAEWWAITKNQLITQSRLLERAWLSDVQWLAPTPQPDGFLLNFSVPSQLHKDEFVGRFSTSVAEKCLQQFQQSVGVQVQIDAHRLQERKPQDEIAVAVKLKSPAQQISRAPDMTFANFVTGAANEFAHGAIFLCANAPGVHSNPLFIHSATGLGKTHLLFSFVNHRLREAQANKVLYVTGEEFLSDFVAHIFNNRMEDFRRKYRFEPDAIVIDDIHTLGKGEKVQEELFNTLNHYLLERKQIVITSDQRPSELKSFAERIRTRLAGGVIAEISWPDTQLRLDFIRYKAEQHGIELAEDVVHRLAQLNDLSLRELQGVLQTVQMQVKVRGRPVDLTSLQQFLGTAPSEKKSLALIQRLVCEHFRISAKEFASPCREQRLSLGRQVFMFIAQQHDFTSTDTGRSICRDHSTVLSGIKKIKKALESDPHLQEQIQKISARLTPISPPSF